VSDRTLTNGDVEAIADALARKVAEIVGARSTTFGLVDARELAEELGVSIERPRDGARRNETRSRQMARIHFDLDPAGQALEVGGATREREASAVGGAM